MRHPNLNREDEVYTPPAELARLHLRTTIESVLERPPVQGKAALVFLQHTVESDYFPDEVDGAERVLRQTPIAQAKRNLIREFLLGCLVSIMREALSEKQRLQRLAAARGTERLHPTASSEILRENFDKWAFGTADDRLCRVLWLLFACPDYQSLVGEATWTKLQKYVENMPSTETEFLPVALEIIQLRGPAMDRLAKSNATELAKIIGSLRTRPNRAFIERCVSAYSAACNFDDANTIAWTLVEPLIKYRDAQHAQSVIAAGANSQVAGSFSFPGVVRKLKNASLLDDQTIAEAIEKHKLTRALGDLLPEGAS